jgi:hypothetical protein
VDGVAALEIARLTDLVSRIQAGAWEEDGAWTQA